MDPPIENDTQSMKLNKKLLTDYKPYHMISDVIQIRNKNKFVANIVHDDKIILKVKYVLLGSYSKNKNFWIWLDQSFVIHKEMIKMIGKLRAKIKTKNITDNTRKFVSDNYCILPSIDLYNHLSIIEETINNDVITVQDYSGGDNIIVFVVKRILFNGFT